MRGRTGTAPGRPVCYHRVCVAFAPRLSSSCAGFSIPMLQTEEHAKIVLGVCVLEVRGEDVVV